MQAVVEAALPGHSLVGVWRLRGGIAHGMHALRVKDREGRRRTVVVRGYSQAQLAYEPDAAVRERWPRCTRWTRRRCSTWCGWWRRRPTEVHLWAKGYAELGRTDMTPQFLGERHRTWIDHLSTCF